MAEDSVIEKNTSENAEQTQKLPSESELSCQGDGALKTADSAGKLCKPEDGFRVGVMKFANNGWM